MNQAIEVSVAKPGYRRDVTWNKIAHSLRFLPNDQYVPFDVYLSKPASQDDAFEVISLLKQLLHETIQQDKKQRISNWKKRLRACESEQYAWLKNRTRHRPVALTIVNQVSTANTHARLDAISSVWKKIYSIHKNANHQLVHFFKNMVNT